MKYIITDHVILSRASDGPLAAHIRAFAESLSAQGYALTSIHRHVLLAACFSQWLQEEGVALRH
ncbi:MAG: integrase, partial [Acidobacteriota bacterium]